MKIDQYCQRRRCKHVELQQFLACFRVARVCQRQLGFLVLHVVEVITGSGDLLMMHLINVIFWVIQIFVEVI